MFFQFFDVPGAATIAGGLGKEGQARSWRFPSCGSMSGFGAFLKWDATNNRNTIGISRDITEYHGI